MSPRKPLPAPQRSCTSPGFPAGVPVSCVGAGSALRRFCGCRRSGPRRALPRGTSRRPAPPVQAALSPIGRARDGAATSRPQMSGSTSGLSVLSHGPRSPSCASAARPDGLRFTVRVEGGWVRPAVVRGRFLLRAASKSTGTLSAACGHIPPRPTRSRWQRLGWHPTPRAAGAGRALRRSATTPSSPCCTHRSVSGEGADGTRGGPGCSPGRGKWGAQALPPPPGL